MDQQEIDRRAMEHEYQKELAQGDLTLFETFLWWVARTSPKGIRIIWNTEQTDPYLLRIYLFRSKTAGLYLHRFFRSDGDRDVHNHPWRKALSLILTKGYREYRWNPLLRFMEQVDVRPWTFNRIGRDDFHRVELVRGRCWTLFLSHGRVQAKDGHDWGFLDTNDGGYTPWGEYVGELVVA